jgi:ethanolamine utilization protein EutA
MWLNVIGLDIGSTTCRAVAYRGKLVADGLRMRLIEPLLVWCAPVQLTPFSGSLLDLDAFPDILEAWQQQRSEGRVGVIITGLAARAPNRPALDALLYHYFDDAVLVSAEEPAYESWLAFMGSIAGSSRRMPEARVMHFDIGGGTTNIAVGSGGSVEAVGSYFVGARHMVQSAGGWERISEFVATFHDQRPEAVVRRFVAVLEACVLGRPPSELAQLALPAGLPGPSHLSFSGGISPWIYGEPPADPRAFGDLGVYLARAIRASPVLGALPWLPLSEPGLATVSGLALFGAHFSGSSVHVGLPLPCRSVPVVGSWRPGETGWDQRLSVAI